ncbi:MAG: hypothetical protein ACNA77_05570, partial [Opitutales bacterium]
LLVAMILLLGLASTYPALHSALHDNSSCSNQCEQDTDEDSGDGGHLCGVTLMQIGALLGDHFPCLNALELLSVNLKPANEATVTYASYRLPKSRAPPMVGML